MTPNIQQVRDHLTLLTGSDKTPVTWQVFYDPKGEAQRPELANHFVGTLDDNLAYFQQAQASFCGIYVGVNETDGVGRKKENVTGYRAVFADFDGIAEPIWATPPHFITRRDETHGHAYWLIDGNVDLETFQQTQMRIAVNSGSDKQVYDPSRVLRVCGFNHYKNPQSPQQYSVHKINEIGRKYTVAEINNAFVLTPLQEAEIAEWIDKRNGIKEGEGYTDEPRYIEMFRKWCEVIAPVAVQGSGSLTAYGVASYGHDHGVSLEKATDIMWELYNPRCEPRWEEHEKNNFTDIISRSYEYAVSAPGCKTASAIFKAAEELPEPVDGWDANQALREPEALSTTVEAAMASMVGDGRLDYEEASVALPQLTEKSPHYDLARAFDGVCYKGGEIVRCNKTYFRFNGKSWKAVDEDVLKASIQKFFAKMKPSDKLTRGIFNVMSDLINVDEIENGIWLTGGEGIDPKNVMVFNNGLVDLADPELRVRPHNSNYFTFNHSNYDFKREAGCPEWLKFLDSIWGEAEDLKAQLQEWMGYLLTSDTRYQKFAILVGKSRGGKGVIGEIMQELVGRDNVAAPALEDLADSQSKYSMSCARLTLIPDAHDVSFTKRNAVLSTFKAITGNDPITFKQLYKNSVTKPIQTRIVLSTNNMPNFQDASGAFANRMLVFPIFKSFKGKEDFGLKGRLLAELSGIAEWAVQGLVRLNQRGGFTEAQDSIEEREGLADDMFILADYVQSMCDVTGIPTTVSEVDTLYSAYRLWCTIHGKTKPMEELQFSGVLKSSSLDITPYRKMINGVRKRCFRGISVNPEVLQTMAVSGNRVQKMPPMENAG